MIANHHMSNSLADKINSFEKRFPSQAAYFYAIVCHLFFVIGHYFVQLASNHLKSIQILYLMGLQLACYSFITLEYNNMSPYSNKIKTTKMLLLRGVIGLFGAALFLTGLPMVPLSEAVIIQQTSPVIVGILAICLLNEKYDLRLFLVTILSFGGVILVSKPSFIFGTIVDAEKYPLRTLGIILGLLGSFVGAIAQIIIKKLGSISDPYSTAYYFGFFLSIFGPIIQLFQGIHSLDFYDVIWIILLGILRFLSHYLSNKSFALESASKISVISYLQVPFAYIIDICIVGISIDFYSVIGSLSVFSCLFIMLYKKHTASKTTVTSSIK